MKEPCLKCLRARKRLRDLAALISGSRADKTLVETSALDLTLDRQDNIIAVSHDDYRAYVGIKVFVDGRQLVQDIDPPRYLVELGFILKTSRID